MQSNYSSDSDESSPESHSLSGKPSEETVEDHSQGNVKRIVVKRVIVTNPTRQQKLEMVPQEGAPQPSPIVHPNEDVEAPEQFLSEQHPGQPKKIQEKQMEFKKEHENESSTTKASFSEHQRNCSSRSCGARKLYVVCFVVILVAIGAILAGVFLAGNSGDSPAGSSVFASSNAKFDGTSHFMVKYKIKYETGGSGCESHGSGTDIVLSCGKEVELPPQPNNVKCERISQTNLKCGFGPGQEMALACSNGVNAKDLQLNVRVDADMRECDGYIDYVTSGCAEVLKSGGSAYHEVTVFASGGPSNQFGTTDVSCLSPSKAAEKGACSTQSSCSVGLACQSCSFYTCSGSDTCIANIPAIKADVISDSISNFAVRSSSLDAGGVCDFDSQCKSGVCILGVCASGKIGLKETCHQDSHCLNGACGKYGSVGSLSCCPSNTHSILAGENWCTEQPEDAACSDDDICKSSVCVNGLCRDEKQTTDEECEKNSHCKTDICIDGKCRGEKLDQLEKCKKDADCKGNVCARYFGTGNYLCCPSGKAVNFNQEKFCKVAVGEECADNSLCGNNKCGLEFYSHNSKRVCCPTGSRTTGLKPDSTWEREIYCRGQADNTFCRWDDLCQSGACGRSEWSTSADYECCPSGKRVNLLKPGENYDRDNYCSSLPSGKSCGTNEQCLSGKCVGNKCVNSLQDVNSSCSEDADCTNGACGRKTFTSNAAWTCCPSGKTTYGTRPDDTYYKSTYCTDQADNTSCKWNDLCKSGACARSEWSNLAGYECCPSGERLYLLKPGEDYYKDYYCSSQPEGKPCGTNELCTSGKCVGNKCVNSLQDVNSSCSEDADCKNGACGRKTFTSNAAWTCCPSGKTTYGTRPDDTYYKSTYCTDQADNTSCKWNDLCKSGACARSEWSNSAGYECCPSGERLYLLKPGEDYYKDYYCSSLPSGKSCGSDAQCASGRCSSNTCS